MMLYAQDHFGFLGDAILDDGYALDLNKIQVEETLAYLLDAPPHKPPATITFRFVHQHFLILTAVTSGYRHIQKRLGIGNKEVSTSGTFSLEVDPLGLPVLPEYK